MSSGSPVDTVVSASDPVSPHDNLWSAITRFLIEMVAWAAGPWALAELVGAWWVAIPAVVILVVVPATFSTVGDKNQVIIATPGPLRIVIELALLAVALGAAWYLWPTWIAVAVTLLGAAMLVTGRERYRWLAQGAGSAGISQN